MTELEQKAEEKIKEWASILYPQMYPVALVKDFIRKAYIAGAKENGIQWHDLRKNPEDLPTKNCTVLIYTDWQGMELKTFFIDTRLFGNLTFREVIAWAEIPEFKE